MRKLTMLTSERLRGLRRTAVRITAELFGKSPDMKVLPDERCSYRCLCPVHINLKRLISTGL